MYIGAVPKTPRNSAYIAEQAETFLAGKNPPDFGNIFEEGKKYVGLGVDADIKGPIGRVAMGLPPIQAAVGISDKRVRSPNMGIARLRGFLSFILR